MTPEQVAEWRRETGERPTKPQESGVKVVHVRVIPPFQHPLVKAETIAFKISTDDVETAEGVALSAAASLGLRGEVISRRG